MRAWKRLAVGTGLALLVALAACGGPASTEERRELANLRRYAPHGHHFIDTINTDAGVRWTSREPGRWRVRRQTFELGSVAEFEAAFLAAEVDTRAAVEVLSPALNLEAPEGRAAHQRAEAVLEFLAEHGYENAGPVAN